MPFRQPSNITDFTLLRTINVSGHCICLRQLFFNFSKPVTFGNSEIKSAAAYKVEQLDSVVNASFSLFIQVAIDDNRHLPMEITVQKQSHKIKQFLNDGMYVQLKAGCMPYIQDPKVRYFRVLNKIQAITDTELA